MVGLFKKNYSSCLKYPISKNHLINVKSIIYKSYSVVADDNFGLIKEYLDELNCILTFIIDILDT